MKVIATTCLLLVSISAWCQSGLPAWAFKKFEQFSDKYVLSDYIKPQFLEADLSGDKKPDVAILIERKVDKKKGVLILFSGVDKSLVAGAGEPLGNAGNDFEWAHRWNVFQENTTHQTVFKSNGDVAGAKEVKLDRPAIEITEEEGAGGLILFQWKAVHLDPSGRLETQCLRLSFAPFLPHSFRSSRGTSPPRLFPTLRSTMHLLS